ncbi:MAG: prolipoprotein diacylglyceryl transferase [Chitinispirillaceae bacterium]|nr:prolipoprotein diacylglyceryl transferase [Chitinispirillaceae bacterium]
MHPVLFKVFSFPIHSYGVMLAASFLLGIWVASVRAKRAGLNPGVIADVGFWVILSAIVGARAYYVVLHFEEFQGNLLAIVNPFQGGTIGIGGLVMYGGFIGAIVASIIFFVVKKLPFLPYADACAPSIALGVMITRIGCFLNGCCYGSATSHGGVSFPLESAAGVYQRDIHAAGLYPSQLYESAGGLLMLFIILTAGRIKTFPGFQFFLAGFLYAVLRFIVDFTRVYGPDERLGSLSHNQIVCIVMFVVFGGLMLKGFLFKDEAAVTPAVSVTNDHHACSAPGTQKLP